MTQQPSQSSDGMHEAREQMVKAIMHRRDCDRAEAEVIMGRIAGRLGGYTHEEVKQMHPLPPGRDERAGT